mmetsp:Transcript_16679/g.18550  ORF Transcript_16679/g.18550 Transcript_16679/m.18550 type:complete len:1415 (+) Transcript_16679:54-4298(+)
MWLKCSLYWSLLCLSCLIINCTLAQLTGEATSTNKQYGVLTKIISIAEIKTTFNDDIYISLQCPTNDTVPLQYGISDSSGTPQQTGPKDCVNCFPSTTIGPFIGNRSPREFFLQIDNINNCSHVGISVTNLQGEAELRVTTSGGTILASSVAQRGPGVFLCCSTLRERGVTETDNTLTLIVSSALPHNSTLQIRNGIEDINAENTWLFQATTHPTEVVVHVDCPAFKMNRKCNSASLDRGVCVPLLPTQQPLHDYYIDLALRSNYSKSNLNVNNSMYSFALVLDTPTQTNKNLIPANAITSQCRLSFPNLVDLTGNPVQDSISLNTLGFTCNLTEWEVLVERLSNTRKQLDSVLLNDVVFAVGTTLAIGYDLAAVYSSGPYLACRQDIEKELVIEETDTTKESLSFLCNDVLDLLNTTDPCCNVRLRDSQCCIPQNRSTSSIFTVDAARVQSQCKVPTCTETAIDNYAVALNAQEQGCAELREENRVELDVRTGPDSRCTVSIFGSSCSSDVDCLDNLSCIEGRCRKRCESNAECATNECDQGVCLIFDSSDYDPAGTPYFTQCLDKESSNLTMLFLRRQLQLADNASHSEIELSIFTTASSFFCIPSLSFVNETECLESKSCNWIRDCENNDICTEELCLDEDRTDFCCASQTSEGRCLAVLTKQPRCTIDMTEESCNTSSGVKWDKLTNECFMLNVTTREACIPVEECNPAGATSVCDRICIVENVTDQALCVSQGFPLSWSSWTFENVTYGVCTRFAFTAIMCSPYTWIPRRSWTEGQFATRETCIGGCSTNSSLDTELACECQGASTNTSVAECLNEKGSCNDWDGCVLPYNGIICPDGFEWSPFGCRDLSSINETECTGTWFSRATTEDECNQKALVCIEDPSFFVIEQNPSQSRPFGISSKTMEVCQDCGGKFTPFYSWTPSNPEWEVYEWEIKQWESTNAWKRQFQTGTVTSYLAASASHMLLNLKSELLCRHVRTAELSTSIISNCIDTSNSLTAISTDTEFASDSITACDAIPIDVSFQDFGRYSAIDFKIVTNASCFNTEFVVLPISQFEQRTQIPLSTGGSRSTQAGFEARKYLKNRNDIAVGLVLRDGLRIQPAQNVVSGVTFCFLTTNLNVYDSNFKLDYIHIAVNDDVNEDFVVTRLSTTAQDVAEICVNITRPTNFYLVGLEDGWEEKSYLDTVATSEKVMSGIGAAIFVILLLIAVWELTTIVISTDQPIMPIIALAFLTGYLIFNIIYFILLPFGMLNTNAPLILQSIFTELPALFFFTIYSIITMQWAVVFHYSRKYKANDGSSLKTLVIATNSVGYLAFCILLFAYIFIGEEKLTVTCLTEQSEIDTLTAREIIALVYKLLFVGICIGFVGAFLFYGFGITHSLISGSKKVQTFSSGVKGDRNRRVLKVQEEGKN